MNGLIDITERGATWDRKNPGANTTIINSAIEELAETGGVVYIPPAPPGCSYVHDGTIEHRDNVQLTGRGRRSKLEYLGETVAHEVLGVPGEQGAQSDPIRGGGLHDLAIQCTHDDPQVRPVGLRLQCVKAGWRASGLTMHGPKRIPGAVDGTEGFRGQAILCDGFVFETAMRDIVLNRWGGGVALHYNDGLPGNAKASNANIIHITKASAMSGDVISIDRGSYNVINLQNVEDKKATIQGSVLRIVGNPNDMTHEGYGNHVPFMRFGDAPQAVGQYSVELKECMGNKIDRALIAKLGQGALRLANSMYNILDGLVLLHKSGDQVDIDTASVGNDITGMYLRGDYYLPDAPGNRITDLRRL